MAIWSDGKIEMMDSAASMAVMSEGSGSVTDQALNMEAVQVPIGDLHPHPRNYRVHTDEQLQHIMESIRDHGIYRPIVAAKDLTILAGHGVWEACQRLMLESVPVVVLPLHPHDPRATKLLVGDNEISNLAEDNEAILASLLKEIQESTPTGLLGTGYDDAILASITATMATNDPDDEDGGGEEVNPYTHKVETPVYTPQQEYAPDVWELYGTTVRDKLVAEIGGVEVPEEVRDFLLAAAERHVVFDYENIAEFYCHADADVQRLIEASALVIIDFEQAIARGYVRARDRFLAMTEEAREARGDVEAADE